MQSERFPILCYFILGRDVSGTYLASDSPLPPLPITLYSKTTTWKRVEKVKKQDGWGEWLSGVHRQTLKELIIWQSWMPKETNEENKGIVYLWGLSKQAKYVGSCQKIRVGDNSIKIRSVDQ